MCRVGLLTTVLIHRVVMRHKQDNVGKALKTVTDTMYISFKSVITIIHCLWEEILTMPYEEKNVIWEDILG